MNHLNVTNSENFSFSYFQAYYPNDLLVNDHLWFFTKWSQWIFINNQYCVKNAGISAPKKYHPDDLKMIRQRLEHFNHHDIWEGYYRIKHADGHYIWMLSKNQVLKRDESGKPLLIGGLMTTANSHPDSHHQLLILAKEEMQKLHQNKITLLTEREREILRYIAAGESYTRIAKLLTIEPDTVKRHRKNIEQKLGLHNVALLACFAKEAGLV